MNVQRSGAASEAAKRAGSLDLAEVLCAVWVVFAAILAIVSPTDPDLFWHLADGRSVLADGFPKGDLFSFTARGHAWIAQEWVFDVATYWLTKTVGFWLPVLLAGLLQGFATWLFVVLVRTRGAGPALTALLTGVFLLFVVPTWGVRAQLVTVPFAAAFNLVLLRVRRGQRGARSLAVLPALMFAWVNLHASYSLGLLLLGVHVLGAVSERVLSRHDADVARRPLRPLLVTTAACAFVTLLNPVGAKLWIYPLPYILAGTPDIRFVAEWQSPDFHDPVNLVLAGTLLLLGVVGLGRPVAPRGSRRLRLPMRARFDITDAGLVALGTLMALRYSRLAPVFGVLVLPVLGQSLARTFPLLSRKAARVARAAASPGGGHRVPAFDYAFAAVVLALFAVYAATSSRAQLGAAPRTDGRFAYPVKAAEVLRAVEGARVFNDYAWGGYLVYTLYPHAFVFIDGRADPYRDGVFQDYIAVRSGDASFEAILDRSGSDFVLVPPDALVATLLASRPGWTKRYEDGAAVLYARVTGGKSSSTVRLLQQ